MLDWLACAFVKALGAVLCRLPPSAAVWIGEQAGTLAFHVSGKRARLAMANLRAAFDGQLMPRQVRTTIRRCYQLLGASVVEMLRLPAMDAAYMDRYVTVEGLDRFEQAAASGRPVILLTGHYGNWEISSIAAALRGHPIVALARAQGKFPRLYRLLVSYRESKGCTIVHKGGAMKRLIAALHDGRMVGIVGDQASRQGAFVDFFGRPALFARGPFALARQHRAIILPAFIHRVGGPCHRIVVEPPIELPPHLSEADAVAQAMQCFAGLLQRHITEDPAQWLWMHNRWKHTSARRALILSDGKRGHVKQSETVIEALRERYPQLRAETVEIRFRHGLARASCLALSRVAPAAAARALERYLTPESARALLTRYADLIVSAGASVAPVNAVWAAENRAQAIAVMDPSPVPLSRFALIIAPRHDRLPRRSNVVETLGSLSRMDPEALAMAPQRLQRHPRYRPPADASRPRPVVAVFVGGDTPDYVLTAAFAETLAAQILAACEAADAWCAVTTSRRTSPDAEKILADRFGRHPRCRMLLLASRDPLDGTMEGLLGSAAVAVVTGESISMVSEACASRRAVVVVEPALRDGRRAGLTKHQRFLHGLAADGHIRLHPLPELGHAIGTALRQPPTRPIDNYAVVRDAVARLS